MSIRIFISQCPLREEHSKKGCFEKQPNSGNVTVDLEGFEPPAFSLGGSSSVLLSYRSIEAVTRVELV